MYAYICVIIFVLYPIFTSFPFITECFGTMCPALSLSRATTPLVLDQWETLLQGYTEGPYLFQGIREGFRLGVCPKSKTWSAKPSKRDHSVLQKLKEEVRKGRVLGPFATPPHPNLHTSPITAIEKKKRGTYRLIHNLSAPRGGSVNDAIPAHLKSVAYCYVQDVVQHILQSGAEGQYMCKLDIKEAFRIVPVHPEDWKWLGMQIDGSYYMDTTLPMGCSTSCAIFQSITRALCWMARQRMPGIAIFGYLDDFLIVSNSKDAADQHMTGFCELCHCLGIPLADEKTVGPTTRLTFLGIGIDTLVRRLFLDDEKIADALEKIRSFRLRRNQRRQQWQSLVGTLSFLSQVVLPGRAFMSRISSRLGSDRHWIHIDEDTKEDLQCWSEFIQSKMFKPFRMLDVTACPTIHIFTDASGSLGFGALSGEKWFYGAWGNSWWSQQNIMLLELYPIWLAIQLWRKSLRDACVMIHTDNQAVIPVLLKRSSRLRPVNRMLRDISLVSMQFNILINAVHIPGVDNRLADLLSRLQVDEFLLLAGDFVDPTPTTIPQNLQPSSYKNTLVHF